MFTKKSSEQNSDNANIASNGSVAATNVNAPVTIQNISPRLCQKEEILKMLFSSNPEDWTYSDEDGIYYLSNDISLQIKEIRSDESESFNEPWVKKYPDQSATRAIFTICYGDTKIDKYYFASVDGGRMFIPYPKSSNDLRITLNQYLLGKIINYPWKNGYDFDDYLQRANIVTDENPR